VSDMLIVKESDGLRDPEIVSVGLRVIDGLIVKESDGA